MRSTAAAAPNCACVSSSRPAPPTTCGSTAARARNCGSNTGLESQFSAGAAAARATVSRAKTGLPYRSHMDDLRYLRGYNERVLNQVRALIDSGRLGEVLRNRYGSRHQV